MYALEFNPTFFLGLLQRNAQRKRWASYLFRPEPASESTLWRSTPGIDPLRSYEEDDFMPELTLAEKARGIINTMNGTLSRKQMERFLEQHIIGVLGLRHKYVFPALVTFCVGDEFVSEQVDVEAHIQHNTGFVRLCTSRIALEQGFALAYDTRWNIMKLMDDTLVIMSRPGAENEFVIWIRHANMPDPL